MAAGWISSIQVGAGCPATIGRRRGFPGDATMIISAGLLCPRVFRGGRPPASAHGSTPAGVLGHGSYCFVPTRHFGAANCRPVLCARSENAAHFGRTRNLTRLVCKPGGGHRTFPVLEGPAAQRLAALGVKDLRHRRLEFVDSRTRASKSDPGTLSVRRVAISARPSASGETSVVGSKASRHIGHSRSTNAWQGAGDAKTVAAAQLANRSGERDRQGVCCRRVGHRCTGCDGPRAGLDHPAPRPAVKPRPMPGVSARSANRRHAERAPSAQQRARSRPLASQAMVGLTATRLPAARSGTPVPRRRRRRRSRGPSPSGTRRNGPNSGLPGWPGKMTWRSDPQIPPPVTRTRAQAGLGSAGSSRSTSDTGQAGSARSSWKTRTPDPRIYGDGDDDQRPGRAARGAAHRGRAPRLRQPGHAPSCR